MTDQLILTTALTKDELCEFLDYDVSTGDFKWIKTTSKNKEFLLGKTAGNVSKSTGYIQIKLKGKLHYAHRLAWLYHYGVIPVKSIDHIDMNKCNNKISNLRLASSQENQYNRLKTEGCTSSFMGVSFKENEQKWMAAYQTIDGIRKCVGHFTSEIEAALAVESLMRKERGAFFNEYNSVESTLKRKLLQPITADDVTGEMRGNYVSAHKNIGSPTLSEQIAAAYNAVIKHRSEAK